MERATLKNVESINYDGSTLEVTFEDGGSIEDMGSLQGAEAVPKGPKFNEGYHGRDKTTGAPITIEYVPKGATAGVYYIDEKDMFVDEYNGCSEDEQVYQVTYRDGDKMYALPESRIE